MLYRRRRSILILALLAVTTPLLAGLGALASSGAAITSEREHKMGVAVPLAPPVVGSPARGSLSYSSPISSPSKPSPIAVATISIAADGATAQSKRRGTLMTPQLAAQIVATARAYNLDPFLVLEVMRQESAFKPWATSYKDGAPCARGLMQMVEGTDGRFGVTDPYDPQQAITGGCRYLVFLMQRFGGNLPLVLAAYNAGEGAVEKYGRAVPPYAETRNYVASILLAYQRARAVAENKSGAPSPRARAGNKSATSSASDLRRQLANIQQMPAVGVEQ